MIDANEECIKRAIKNFYINNINTKTYFFIQKAVGDKKGTVIFSDIGGTSCLNKILGDENRQKTNTKICKMTTIDEEVKLIGNPPCAFIKLDLEGYDYQGLVGAKNTFMTKHLKLVKFERWPTVELLPFLKFFDNIKWECFALDKGGNPTYDENLIKQSLNLFAMPRTSKWI